MTKTVVIYESKYGFTKRYALWISQALSCPIFERKNFHPQDFSKYDTIIYGGGLYAGGVSGIKLLTKNYPQISNKHIVLFTCGLTSTDNPTNITHIQTELAKVLSHEMLNHISLFHLRGGIDYAKLSFIHKTMMNMLKKMLSQKSDTELTAEDRQLLETYGKSVDFTDKTAIEPILKCVRNL
ncbi:MAG: flavodoxin domain-containing protein [Lachnospiraceae bacterium]|nr:flavodoxin domain-containing protein [Lachnospiraceae bacterium]